MAWAGTIIRTYPNPVPADFFYIDVSFTDGTNTITQTFKITASNFKTQDDVTTFVNAKAADLNSLYTLMETLPNTETTAVPEQVTMFQCRAILSQMGILSQVDSAMQAAGGDALLAWEYAGTVHRQSPLVNSMATQLSLTSDQVDQMFIQASTITV